MDLYKDLYNPVCDLLNGRLNWNTEDIKAF